MKNTWPRSSVGLECKNTNFKVGGSRPSEVTKKCRYSSKVERKNHNLLIPVRIWIAIQKKVFFEILKKLKYFGN